MTDTIETAFAAYVAGLPRADGGVQVGEMSGLGIATVIARAGKAGELGAKLGVDLIDAPKRTAAGSRAAIGTGPGAWLLLDEAPDEATWFETLEQATAGLASVFDQSSGYAMLRVEGPQAAALIGKGAFLDLHPSAFPSGSAAVTVIAHIGAILWRVEHDRFEIAVFRSFAGSFWHWLATAAMASGIPLRRA